MTVKSSVIAMVAVVALACGCKPTPPKGVMSADEMEDVLYDYHLAMALSSDSDAVTQEMYMQAVLDEHETDKAAFDTSLVYYYRRADLLRNIYKRVAKRIDDYAVLLGASSDEFDKYSRLTSDGDTADVWNGADRLVLMPQPLFNRADINLVCDSTYKAGDRFQLRLLPLYVKPTQLSREGVAYLSVAYRKLEPTPHDTLVNRYIHINATSTIQEMNIEPPTPNAVPVSIRGYLYMGDGKTYSTQKKDKAAVQQTQLLFLTKIQLIRFHAKKKDEQQKDSNSPAAPAVGTMAADSAGGGAERPGEMDSLLRAGTRVAIHRMGHAADSLAR